MIKQWASQVGTQKYRIFNSSSRFQELNITTYQFDDELIKKEYIIQIRNLIREAENRIRTMRGIPHIGEGWISETQLYYEIKQAFPYLDVQHHASPQWLGRQHLDIFIPELLIAIEYQGRQHDEPIDFFGGISAFQNTLKRDAYKRELCHQNNVKLIEVRSNYDIEEIIQQIKTRLDP